MALEITQSVVLNGTSVIKGKPVATFTTTVTAEQLYSNVSMSITDQNVYADNKKAVRDDRDSFQDKADAIADGLETAPAEETVAK